MGKGRGRNVSGVIVCRPAPTVQRVPRLGIGFAARLAERAFDPADQVVKVGVHLGGTKNRILVTRDDPGRLHDWYIASVPLLENTWACKREELTGSPDSIAVKAALWFFERFNWQSATEELIGKLQRHVFTRR
jgi:hypothetical protein